MTLHPDTIHDLSDALRGSPAGTVEIRIHPEDDPNRPHVFTQRSPDAWEYEGTQLIVRSRTGQHSERVGRRLWSAHGADGNLLHAEVRREALAA